jgi:hypothetical protein
MASSVNEGGRATRKRMIAETTPKTSEQVLLLVMFRNAIVPVKLT